MYCHNCNKQLSCTNTTLQCFVKVNAWQFLQTNILKAALACRCLSLCLNSASSCHFLLLHCVYFIFQCAHFRFPSLLLFGIAIFYPWWRYAKLLLVHVSVQHLYSNPKQRRPSELHSHWCETSNVLRNHSAVYS